VNRIFTAENVANFGELVQDKNILHSPMNWEEALTKMPEMRAQDDSGLIQLQQDGVTTKPLVHGMLVSSIFSSIFAALVPGCVYMNQTLNFVAPLHVDDVVLGRIEIEKVRKWRRGGVVVQCDTQVLSKQNRDKDDDCLFDSPVIKGTANVWLPSGYALLEEASN
jgi:acyl dehydratase